MGRHAERGRALTGTRERADVPILLIVVVVIAAAVVGALISPVPLAHIQLAAEDIGHLGGIPITNTMLAGWVTTLVVVLLFWRGMSSPQMVPGGLQNFVEFATEF